jgi:dTDP-4-dehydrorhamnose 3,5-epimerase-like enzyme
MDDGLQKQEIVLNSGSEGLFMDRMIWHEMHDLTSDCVLLVLCNEPYYESDYIRDYNEFLKLIKTIVK